MACDRVEALRKNDDWEVVLVQGQNKKEEKDGVAYIYKRKTPQRLQWEKEQGYL